MNDIQLEYLQYKLEEAGYIIKEKEEEIAELKKQNKELHQIVISYECGHGY